jgi:hypothetical protein
MDQSSTALWIGLGATVIFGGLTLAGSTRRRLGFLIAGFGALIFLYGLLGLLTGQTPLIWLRGLGSSVLSALAALWAHRQHYEPVAYIALGFCCALVLVTIAGAVARLRMSRRIQSQGPGTLEAGSVKRVALPAAGRRVAAAVRAPLQGEQPPLTDDPDQMMDYIESLAPIPRAETISRYKGAEVVWEGELRNLSKEDGAIRIEVWFNRGKRRYFCATVSRVPELALLRQGDRVKMAGRIGLLGPPETVELDSAEVIF